MGLRLDTGSNTADGQQGPPKKKLNVIMHGDFAFDQKDKIIAHIPDMGSEHLYKAGSWFAETTLREHADLTLDGVDDGPQANRLLPDHNIIVGDVTISGTAHDCHCIYATLRLPYPTSPIRSLRPVRIPADALGGDDKPRIVDGKNVLESATIQVLTYEFTDDAKLRLGDHPWEPVLENGCVNLHVFSEPERNVTDDHLRHAFQASLGLFAGLDLTLKGRPQPFYGNEELPEGVNPLELQDLVQRQRWLTVLGRAIKERRDVNFMWDDPSPFSGSDACCACAASF